jgi:glycerophosphoryl diester phosphodiesterase
MLPRRLLLLFALLFPCAAPAEEPKLHRIVPATPAALQEIFRSTPEPLPFVSGHRGGPDKGYPENCLPTFERTLAHTYAILEIDPRMTSDGEIVVHHDATLERTTNGRGKVADHTLAELKALRLKDSAGVVTEHQMPTLHEALEWARGRTVLVLDQKDVPMAERVKQVTEHQAEAFAMVIAYSYKDLQACYAQNPNVMMEVMVPNLDKVAEFDKLGVPWANIVAFVGHDPPHDPAVYEAIHARGARCLIGTSRNLDRRLLKGEVADIEPLLPEYRAFLARGADLIETDIPVPLGGGLYREMAVPALLGASFKVE